MTERILTAGILAVAHQQGMVLIKHGDISGQVIHEEGMVGIVAIAIRGYSNSIDYPPGVGINNENRLVCHVQQYGISRLLAHPVDRKELLAEFISGNGT